MTAVLHLSGQHPGEHYVVRADHVAGVRRLDHEPLGGEGASYEILLVGFSEPIPVDEDSAGRVEDHLVSLADEGPPEEEAP